MTTTLAGRRILVVEDEYFLADDLARALRAGGAEVIGPTPSVDAALDVLDGAGRLDGAVVDLNLQGEMAFPVVDALRERGVAIVLATGYDRAAIPARYADIARCGKPTDPAAVARALFG